MHHYSSAALAVLPVVAAVAGILGYVLAVWRGRRRLRVEVALFNPRWNAGDLVMWKATNTGHRPVRVRGMGLVIGLTRIGEGCVGVPPDAQSHDDSRLPKMLEDHDVCYVGQDINVVCDCLRQEGRRGECHVRAFFEDADGRRHRGRARFAVNVDDRRTSLARRSGAPQGW